MNLLLFAGQGVSLFAVVCICICRINAMSPQTRPSLRSAYVILACGAFSLLATTAEAGHYDWRTALFAAGVAYAFAADRRKSGCYHP